MSAYEEYYKDKNKRLEDEKEALELKIRSLMVIIENDKELNAKYVVEICDERNAAKKDVERLKQELVIYKEKDTPKTPIIKSWNPSLCPNCKAELSENLGDGYYKDYENMKICECGQKLNWNYKYCDEDKNGDGEDE